MSANTKIEWCHHTFNPWRGCTKVSAGCANCYAETLSKRNPKVLGIWGDNGTRVVASEAMWREPLKWNAVAEKAGERYRVFCGSLCDVCEDRPELELTRTRLKTLIQVTPQLDWLLLSKRPENYLHLFWPAAAPIWKRVWAGTSIENQETAEERVPHLLKVPAAVRFLSIEPLLGPIDLVEAWGKCLKGSGDPQWVIFGGESGGKARPCNVAWIRDIVQQCKAAGVPCFVKQIGSKPYLHEHRSMSVNKPNLQMSVEMIDIKSTITVNHFKGGDMGEWPEDLRVREFPKVSAT